MVSQQQQNITYYKRYSYYLYSVANNVYALQIYGKFYSQNKI